MKLIIAGGRKLNVSSRFIKDCIDIFGINWSKKEKEDYLTEIVSGCATGIDSSGEDFAFQYSVKLKRFPADWGIHGKKAGPIRNRKMAEYADTLLLIWDGESRGSANMKKEMQFLGKRVYEVILR